MPISTPWTRDNCHIASTADEAAKPMPSATPAASAGSIIPIRSISRPTTMLPSAKNTIDVV